MTKYPREAQLFRIKPGWQWEGEIVEASEFDEIGIDQFDTEETDLGLYVESTEDAFYGLYAPELFDTKALIPLTPMAKEMLRIARGGK